MYVCQDKPTDIFTHSAHLNIITYSKNITNTPQNNQERFQEDFSPLYLTGYLTSFKLLGKFVYHQKTPHCLLFYNFFRVFKKNKTTENPQQ